MLILDSENRPITLEDTHTPLISDSFWVLDLDMRDYTLAPLQMLEEVVASTIFLSIEGFTFPAPAKWHILIIDDETSQLDTVELRRVAGREFRAFIYGPNETRYKSSVISVVDFKPSYHNVGPSLFKNQMLCHPISNDMWVNISPSDGFNKYLKHLSVGDIL